LRIQRLRSEARRLAVENSALWDEGGPALVVGPGSPVEVAGARTGSSPGPSIRRMNRAAEALVGEAQDKCLDRPLAEILGTELFTARVLAKLSEAGAAHRVGSGMFAGTAVRLAGEEILVLLGGGTESSAGHRTAQAT